MVTAVSIFESKNLLQIQSSGMYQSDTIMSRVLAWKYSVTSMVDDMVVDGSLYVLVVCMLFLIVDRPKNRAISTRERFLFKDLGSPVLVCNVYYELFYIEPIDWLGGKVMGFTPVNTPLKPEGLGKVFMVIIDIMASFVWMHSNIQ